MAKPVAFITASTSALSTKAQVLIKKPQSRYVLHSQIATLKNTPLTKAKPMPFKPTEEQLAIIEAAKDSTDNLAVIARAGAAKTTTLVMMAEALPDTDILCLAFNKSIQKEMEERLPPNCEAKTLHGLGYRAWFQFLGRSCKIDDKKVYNLLSARIEKLDYEDRKDAYDSMAETLDFIRKGKASGYLPDSYRGHWKPILGDHDFFPALPMEPTRLQINLIRDVSEASFKLSLQGQIDFDDMVMCPTLCSVPWPRPDLLLVDEAQDLSPLNHVMLKKIVKNRRIIAVGDPLQAIYGFRGADVHSMRNMSKMFNMDPYYLTTTFRCAQSIVKNAHWRAPDMKAAEWAEEGEVLRPKSWAASDINDGDAIICRNNAPLFSLAIKLIKEGRLPTIAGRDIALPLKKIMKKLGKAQDEQKIALAALEEWQAKEIARARDGAIGQIKDRAACVRIMLEQTETLGDAIAYLDHLLKRDGRIELMTGHKSKGLEFNTVFFLDQFLCNIKDHEQDANIKYVVETRAKKKLVYVTTDHFEETVE